MPDDDGYVYQEFFSGEDSGGDGCFSRGGCLGGGCSTIVFIANCNHWINLLCNNKPGNLF